MINYIVEIQDRKGHRQIDCETVSQVWEAIRSRCVGGLYKVTSPTNKSTSDFIPF